MLGLFCEILRKACFGLKTTETDTAKMVLKIFHLIAIFGGRNGFINFEVKNDTAIAVQSSVHMKIRTLRSATYSFSKKSIKLSFN